MEWFPRVNSVVTQQQHALRSLTSPEPTRVAPCLGGQCPTVGCPVRVQAPITSRSAGGRLLRTPPMVVRAEIVLLFGGKRSKSSEHTLWRSVGQPVSLGDRLAGHSAVVDIQSVSQMRVFE